MTVLLCAVRGVMFSKVVGVVGLGEHSSDSLPTLRTPSDGLHGYKYWQEVARLMTI